MAEMEINHGMGKAVNGMKTFVGIPNTKKGRRNDFYNNKYMNTAAINMNPCRLYASIDRLVRKGILPKRYRFEIECAWVENDKCSLAYVYTNQPNKVFFTKHSYPMPDRVIDVLMWHEICHLLTDFADHEDQVFKDMQGRKRGQRFLEWWIYVMDVCGRWG